jgi:hypothetical protein
MLSLVSCKLSCCDQITSKESTPKDRGFETNPQLRGQAPSVKVPTTPAIQTKAFGPYKRYPWDWWDNDLPVLLLQAEEWGIYFYAIIVKYLEVIVEKYK